MPERRTEDRRRVIKGCRVIFNNQNSSVDCLVRNMSDDGARLQIENAHFVPDEFDLFITQSGKKYPCKVAWRRGDEVGVAFTGPAINN